MLTVALVAITLATSASDVKAQSMKSRIVNNVTNIRGSVAINNSNSNNVTNNYTDARQWHTTTTDSRQWHSATTTTTTDSRQWYNREGDRTETVYAPRAEPIYAPAYVAPKRYYAPSRLMYATVVDGGDTTIAIRCWAPCGGYFIDAEGRRFSLLPTYSKVAVEYRYATLPGRYRRASSGILFFTAQWGATIRTFSHEGL